MPKRDKFRKQHNQLSVANIFTGNTSTSSSPQIESENPNPLPSPKSSTSTAVPEGLDLSELTEDNRNFIPVNKNRKKKRRRETGDSIEKASPSEHNIRTESKKKTQDKIKYGIRY